MTARLLPLALFAAGCSPAPPAATVPASPGFPVTVTDALGRAVTVPARPARVISLAPAVTETLFALGAGGRVVGVTTFDNHPPEVKALPAMGGFLANTVNIEAIVGARPDVVFTVGQIHRPVVEALEAHRVAVVAVEPATCEAAADALELVARVAGEPEAGARLAGDFRRRLAAVRDRAAAVPADKRPTVLYVVGVEPLIGAGSGSFVGQMLEIAGGRNVLADAPQQYPRVADEAVVARDPAVILTPDGGHAGLADDLRRRPGWAGLGAVRAGRVRAVPEDLVSRPGPRLIDGLEALERALRD